MKKNVASQKIGAQMVSATDGSAFTGSVTVAVTLDAGVQATGSVGSGACTHEGNGYHTYAPAQAETNGDLLAFTFTGSGAIPATVQVFTNYPSTGDAYLKGVDVETDTQDIQSRLPAALTAGGNIKADALALSGDTVAADNAESFFDGTGYAGTNNVIPLVTTTSTATAVTTVNGLAAGVITATSIAADAITAAKIADGAIDAATLASDTITAAKIASGAITAAKFGASAIDAAALATDAVAEIATAVNAEVVDALNVDTYAEPAQGAPGATISLAAKIGYLYKFLRNKKTQTATTFSVFNDDAATVDHKATTSDDGTTATVGEIASGP